MLKPKACIYIGLDPRLLPSGFISNESIYKIHRFISARIDQYETYLYLDQNGALEHKIAVINGHLNYDAVSYHKGQLKYPDVEDEVRHSIEQALQTQGTDLDNDTPEPEIKLIQSWMRLGAQRKSALQKINKLNNTNFEHLNFQTSQEDTTRIIILNPKLKTLAKLSPETDIRTLNDLSAHLSSIISFASKHGAEFQTKYKLAQATAWQTVDTSKCPGKDEITSDPLIGIILRDLCNSINDLDLDEYQEVVAIDELFFDSFISGITERVFDSPEGQRYD